MRRNYGDFRVNVTLALAASLLFAGVVAGTGAIISAIVMGRVRPAEQQEVARSGEQGAPSKDVPAARLARTVDCVWTDEANSPQVGDDLGAGQKLALASGVAEIVFHDGARVLLQGPAAFTVRSPASAVLNRGKCAVTVENPLARGFEIDAPGMVYTDLGTEFGVLVAQSGEQEMHVFRGMVRVERGNDTEKGRKGEGENAKSPPLPLSPSPPLVLTALQAIRVAPPDALGGAGRPLQRIAANTAEFVRDIRDPLDLADIVAGGDGTTGQTGRGIDPLTGNTVKLKEANINVVGTREYRKVPAVKFVDGVFVPEGSSGPVQLDSASHRYALPKTCGRTDHSIFAETGGPLAAKQRDMPLARGGLADNLAHVLTRSHPQLYLHANVGITFDLEAIRESRPGRRPARFQAVVCTERSGLPAAAMSAWIFVDGQLAFQRQKFHLRDGYFGIDVPLPAGAHYLTLVATDGDLSITSDHVIFHCPQLVMKAAG